MKNVLTLLFACLILLGACHQQNDAYEAGAPAELMELQSGSAIADEEAPSQPQAKIDRKLIKEGSAEWETDDLAETRKTVLATVGKYKGYVSSDEEFKAPGRNSHVLVVRLPADHFDAVLAEATRGVDRFDYKQVNVRDVTEEFVDIQARLNTKKELEKRYQELLKQAGTITDMLEIEREIARLRADIDSIEGRLNYLKDRVAYSTLTLTFYQTLGTSTAFGGKFSQGFRNGWDNLVWFFVMLTNIWPFVLLIILLIAFIKYRKRNKRKV